LKYILAVAVAVLGVYTYLEIAIYDEACLAKEGAAASGACAIGGIPHK
jgi:uncharacterized membrane protein YjfL (UPF0719 family)